MIRTTPSRRSLEDGPDSLLRIETARGLPVYLPPSKREPCKISGTYRSTTRPTPDAAHLWLTTP